MNYKNIFLITLIWLPVKAAHFELLESKKTKPLACFTFLDEATKRSLSKFTIEQFKQLDYNTNDSYITQERLTNSDQNEQLSTLRHLFLQFYLYQFANYRALLNSFSTSKHFFSQLSCALLKYPSFHQDIKIKSQGFTGHQLCHYFHCAGTLEQFSTVPNHIIDELKTFITNKDIYTEADECLFLAFMLYGNRVKSPMSGCLQELFTANPILFTYQKYLEHWTTNATSGNADEQCMFLCVNTLGLQALTYLSETNDTTKQEFKLMLEKTLKIDTHEKRAIIFLALELYSESIKRPSSSYISDHLKKLCALIIDYYAHESLNKEVITKITKRWLSLTSELVPTLISTFFDTNSKLDESLTVYLDKNTEHLNNIQKNLIKLFALFLSNCSRSERIVINKFFQEIHSEIKLKINDAIKQKSLFLNILLQHSNPSLTQQISNYLKDKIKPLNKKQHTEETISAFNALGSYYAESLNTHFQGGSKK